MPTQSLSPFAQTIESLLGGGGTDYLHDYLRQESSRQIEAKGYAPSNYQIFAVRRNDLLGNEVFGPKLIPVATYSEELLYGAVGSPLVRFRAAVLALKIDAERTASLNPDEVEYGHQAALLWAGIGRLKEFIGTSDVISEIVAELRTARFQFLAKDTPPLTIKALASALGLITEAERWDATLVDEIVKALENGGVDSLAPDALRDSEV